MFQTIEKEEKVDTRVSRKKARKISTQPHYFMVVFLKRASQ